MGPPEWCGRGAAVLDVDRGLRRALGARAAARIEARPILPVLAVPAGPWSPPAPEALGPETTALVVIHGLLLAADAGGGRVFGPDDRFAPWSGAAQWTACTPLRL